MNSLPNVSALQVILNRRRIAENPLPFHKEHFEKLGDTFTVSVPREGKVIFSRSATLIKEVLQKKHRHYTKSKIQTVDLAKYIGKGLLTSEGDHWRTHRRMIQPAFHLKELKSLVRIMHATVVEELNRIIPDKEIDVFDSMGDLAFQVVAKSLFSSDHIRQPMAELKEITKRNQTMLVKEMRQPYFTWWFQLSGQIGKHLKLSHKAREILNTQIEERIRSKAVKHDLLDMLLTATYEDGSKMTRRQLMDEVMILFTAGHETTANALSFTLFFLAHDKHLQERLFKEVNALEFQEDIWGDLTKMPLTMSCIKEAMRLFPPVYVIDRVALEDNEVNGWQIKKGTMLLLSLYELHRHTDFWKHPEEFMADRFCTVDTKMFNDCYYPFGAGPRMCIGNNFALFEMAMVMVEIIKNYHLKTPMAKVDIDPLITLKPKEVFVEFVKR